MKSLVWMLVIVIFLSCMAYRAESLSNFTGFNFPESLSNFLDSPPRFPDTLPKFRNSLSKYPRFSGSSSVLDTLITFVDTRNKNKKIGKDEHIELLVLDEVIKSLDQDGDNEVSKDELLKMAKKIIDNYINIFDLDNDGALSEDEFMGKSFDVDEAIKSAQTLAELLFDITGEHFNEIFSFENVVDSITPKQDDKEARILKLLKTALDNNNDNNITKEEVREFASTAIKVSDINKDKKITEQELFQTLEQNNITKKTVDYFRQYSQNKDKTKAWKELFHKIDENKNDGKLYADEIVQLLNGSLVELFPIGQGLIPVYTSLTKQDFPKNADEWYGGVESFLQNKEFKQDGLTSSSAITKVNVILVLTLASTFGAIM